MSEFADDAEVEVSATRPLPGPGHRFPGVDFTLTYQPQGVSGDRANEIKAALPDTTFITADEVTFEVVGDGGGDDLADVVGPGTAANLKDAGIGSLAAAKDASDDELGAVTGVGPATIQDIRDA